MQYNQHNDQSTPHNEQILAQTIKKKIKYQTALSAVLYHTVHQTPCCGDALHERMNGTQPGSKPGERACMGQNTFTYVYTFNGLVH